MRKEDSGVVMSQPCGDGAPPIQPPAAEPSAVFTPSQLKILRDAVWALDHAKRPHGNIRIFDGRKWPAINKLKLAGLLTVEDYDGRGHHDVIELRATEAGRTAIAKATGAAS
jgi:hypothetical protein